MPSMIRLAILALCCPGWICLSAGPRRVISINENWEFFRGELSDAVHSDDVIWQQVTLPHTWNAADPFDEVPGYYRGIGWYRKKLDRDLFPQSARTFLRFEAANQQIEVFVNGASVGVHRGGYTAFCFDITDHVQPGDNWITARVDNSHDPHIVPLKGDFNFYGGIYRDVYLVLTEDVHFSVLDHAGPGAFVSTTSAGKEVAEIDLRMTIVNQGSHDRDVNVTTAILDQAGVPCAADIWSHNLAASTDVTEKKVHLRVVQPKFWSPDHPYLYTVQCEITDAATGEVVDNIRMPLGIRTFVFDADSGFYINGSHLKLVGVNRHQDYPGKGNALSNAEHIRDIQMIKDMGANVYRPAHYPQDPAVLEACDRLGLIVMMEIPLDHDQTNVPAFYENARTMMREMIRQYYNHPSIVIWAYMNEMFLGRRLDRDRVKIDSIVAFARELEDLVRSEDATRYTMIPNHGDFEIYHKSGLTDVPMIIGWNLYYGWYEPEFSGFGDFVDHAHNAIPDKPMIITEYGAGTHPRIRSLQPLRFDFSREWESAFHLSHLKQIRDRPFIAGSAVWNMFDFGSENRNDAMPYVNNKGLCAFDRSPKDVYYLYKAWLTDPDKPVLHLAANEYPYRVLSGDINGRAYVPVQVFGNTGHAELVVNGTVAGVRELVNCTADWEVEVTDGPLVLEVYDPRQPRTLMDRLEVSMHVIGGGNVVDRPVVSCNFGATYFYEEEHSGVIWLPEKGFQHDAWGYLGGEAFNPRNRGVGSDRAIALTEDDPLFQTQRTGVDKVVFRVPPANYALRLLFAEIQGADPGERVFGVEVNGVKFLEGLDIASASGRYVATEFTTLTTALGGEIEVNFIPETGEPVINAIQVVRR